MTDFAKWSMNIIDAAKMPCLYALHTQVTTSNWVIKNKMFSGIPLDFKLKQTSNCKKILK